LPPALPEAFHSIPLGFTKPDGRVVRVDICVVAQFRDDCKIIRIDEYLDSAAAAPLSTRHND
jgi:ketosteroid isomerase-like protein